MLYLSATYSLIPSYLENTAGGKPPIVKRCLVWTPPFSLMPPMLHRSSGLIILEKQMAANQTLQRIAGRDRRLYTWAAVFIPIIVVIGFARSYYLKPFFNTPSLPSVLVHLHGIVMTAWVIMFVTQVSLVAAHRTGLHRRLGVVGAALATAVVFVGLAVAISAAKRAVSLSSGAAGGAQASAALSFLAIPLVDMPVFAILIGIALYFRRRIEIHKRLMLLATLTLLSAAIARIPLHFIATGGSLVFFGLTDLLILAFVAFDTVKNRRLHPAFFWAVPL